MQPKILNIIRWDEEAIFHVVKVNPGQHAPSGGTLSNYGPFSLTGCQCSTRVFHLDFVSFAGLDQYYACDL